MKVALFFLVVIISQISASNVCSQIVTGPRGEFTSPNYPSPYDNNLDCEWLIQVEQNSSVYLTFIDFQTESGSDFVQIYDGDNSANGVLLLTHSGSGPVPLPLKTSGNSLFIRFMSDDHMTLRGFLARYMATV